MLMIPKSLLCSFLHIIKEEKIKKRGVIMDEKLLYNVKEVSKCLGVNVHLVCSNSQRIIAGIKTWKSKGAQGILRKFCCEI